jgi:hypothetical protein
MLWIAIAKTSIKLQRRKQTSVITSSSPELNTLDVLLWDCMDCTPVRQQLVEATNEAAVTPNKGIKNLQHKHSTHRAWQHACNYNVVISKI